MSQYDNLIKVQNGIATRDPVPDFLVGLDVASLADLSWTDPSMGVQDTVWWPAVDQSLPLGEYQAYGAETLTPDSASQTVIVTREVETLAPPVLTRAEYDAAVRRMLDVAVSARNYGSMQEACSYALDQNPAYQAEGRACVAWRSAVRLRFEQLIAEVAAKTRPQPTIAELLAMLPPMTWPA